MESNSTPLRLNISQNSYHDFISPGSSVRKNVHKRTSTGMGLLIPSSCLPEATENELDTARQRRLSRNFMEILSTETDAADTSPCAKWSKDELFQHSSQCLKLAQENKINHKNAFDLQLIEHMGEMIKQDGGLNFRVAGGTIFAGAQIYASRVDALHSQIYRVLGSLNSGDKDDNLPDDDKTDDPEKKAKKRKKNSKILETNKSNLRLQAIAGFTSEELRTRSRNTNIDAASCASLRLNHARFNKNEKVLQHDFGALETQTSPTKSLSCENGDRKFSIRNALKNLPHAEPAAQFTCPFFKDFDFDTMNDLEFYSTSDAKYDKDAKTTSNCTINETVDNDCEPALDNEPLPDDDDDAVFESQADPVAHIKRVDINNAMDVAELVAVAPPTEYSYFVPNVLSVCDGPEHWRKLRSHRTASKVTAKQDEGAEVEKSQTKRRKTEGKRDLFKKQSIQPDKRIQPQKISKARLEALCHNVQDNLLMENMDRVTESLTRAKEANVLLKHLAGKDLRNADVDVGEPSSAVNFNYVNEDYCPAATNDDYDDQDNSQELFSDHTSNFFPDFTQNITNSLENAPNSDDYNALLEGDHLLDHPRKAEKIQIHFAKRAKRIDVRRLKSAMWTLIKDEEETSESEEKDSEELQNQTSQEAQNSLSSSSEAPLLFTDMYAHLPEKVSKNMWENLSVPLAFNCLLHLANERTLKIEGNSSLNDLKISQDFFPKKP